MGVALVARAWLELVHIDLLTRCGFKAIQRAVLLTPTRPGPYDSATVARIVNAVVKAGVWYFKSARCLQRSAVVTRLLRRHGVPAQMVVGCHMMPMRAHAWVEVAGEVVSEHLDDLEHYQVLDRW